jgi:hypothetical protein
MTIDIGCFLDHLTICMACDRPGSEHGIGGWTFREGKPVHTTCVAQYDRDYDALSGISYCEGCHATFDSLIQRAKDNPKMCVECSEYFPIPVVHFDIGELARVADTNIESAEK